MPDQATPSATTPHLADLQRFYSLLDDLKTRSGGYALLSTPWPTTMGRSSGVYFFFEEGETRSGSGSGPRVVRVGTHALHAGGRSTLRGRLRNHRGSANGGNTRTSIFRRHVGGALMRAGLTPEVPGWWSGSTASPAQRALEHSTEVLVSARIGAMPYLWLPVDDPAGPDSDRGRLERGAIALLTQPETLQLDPPSPGWLGYHARRPEVSRSGLWNVRHIADAPDPGFLECLAGYIQKVG